MAGCLFRLLCFRTWPLPKLQSRNVSNGLSVPPSCKAWETSSPRAPSAKCWNGQRHSGSQVDGQLGMFLSLSVPFILLARLAPLRSVGTLARCVAAVVWANCARKLRVIRHVTRLRINSGGLLCECSHNARRLLCRLGKPSGAASRLLLAESEETSPFRGALR